jgi:hypothetical protein
MFQLLIRHSNRVACQAWPAALIVFIAAALLPATVLASPRLRCQIDHGGESHLFEFAPVVDPYGVKTIDIGKSFRFKAVVIGNEQQIDYINIYAYYRSDRQAVLLHEAKFSAPMTRTSTSLDGLTGTNYIYSPRLGREMKYGCALFEVEP